MQPPFEPLRFLDLSRALAAETTDEAQLRTACGRAYYALLIVVRDWTGVEGRRNLHRRVLQALGERGQQGIGARLNDPRRLRDIADYQPVPADPEYADWQQNWLTADELARRLVRRLQQLGVVPKP
jgi:hypothetical protein